MLDYYFWYTYILLIAVWFVFKHWVKVIYELKCIFLYILLIAVWFVFKHWVKVIYEFKCIFFVSKFTALLVPWVTCLFLPLVTWTYMLPVPNFHTLRGENKCHSLQITLFFFFLPCLVACDIFVSWPGIELGPCKWKHRVLITGPPWKSVNYSLLESYICFEVTF